MARKPTPTALLKLRGTLRRGRHRNRQHEPDAPVPGAVFEAPDWFNDSQKAVWHYAVANAPQHVLRKIDRELLAAWCVCADRLRRSELAQAKIDADTDRPFLVRTKEGAVMQSPYVGIANRCIVLMSKLASDLGFSPSSRPRLNETSGLAPFKDPLTFEDEPDGLQQFLDCHPDRKFN